MSHTLLFPGTFDPITNGHIDLIRRASFLFDKVIVAVAADTLGKQPLFDLTERQALANIALEKFTNVKVIAFYGLTVTCALEQGAQAILRGVRSTHDLAFEQQMAAMNRQLAPTIETIFLATAPEYSHVSGTLVRQIAQLQGNIDSLVSEQVAQALRRRYSDTN